MESIEKIKLDSISFLKNILAISNLKLKTNETEAYGILGALLPTVYAKDTLSTTCDYFAVFDFMADSLIPEIFEYKGRVIMNYEYKIKTISNSILDDEFSFEKMLNGYGENVCNSSMDNASPAI